MEFKSENAAELLSAWKEQLSMADAGEVTVGGTPVVIIKKDIFFYFYDRITKIIGPPSATLLYFVGEDYGRNFYRDFVGESEEIIKNLCDAVAASGIGNVKIETGQDTVTVTAEEGLPIGNKAKGRAADSYFAGFFAGFFSQLYGRRYEGVEEECIAKGDAKCRIVLREKED
jgi:predicted hydrocarbon binding protein